MHFSEGGDAAQYKLMYGAQFPGVIHLCACARQALHEKECQMALQDRVQEETNEKKNALEAYIYSLRGKLAEQLAPFASDAERTSLSELLDNLEVWWRFLIAPPYNLDKSRFHVLKVFLRLFLACSAHAVYVSGRLMCDATAGCPEGVALVVVTTHSNRA